MRFLFLALLLSSAACGGALDHTGDDSSDGGDGGKGRNGNPDGGNGYVDPKCPEAGPPQMIHECDVQNPVASCANTGGACYPVAIPPQTTCGSETYGTECLEPGSGQQGAACGGTANCAPGFVCLITGGDTQCARLCNVDQKGSCPMGFVCGPIDVPGFAACL